MNNAEFAILVRPSGEGLPYQAPSQAQVRLVVVALRTAWDQVQGHAQLHSLDEDQMTVLLHQALRNLLDEETVAGFTTDLFSIDRDAKVVSCDGRHPDKMPDLTIGLRAYRPARLPAEFGVQIECKPVNRTIGLAPYYGPDGMQRFVRGEYACKMRLAMMIAYADTGYEFNGRMRQRLSEHRAALCLNAVSAPEAEPPVSSHNRSWRYANGGDPGPIDLLHLWLPRPAG